jgi:phospholipase/lecithinase/hemolysin
MKKFRVLATAVAAAAFLAGCGGDGAGDQAPRVAFTQMVNFGDSLSDVGTYATTIVAANGGGHYSINGDLSADGLAHTNWTEYLAAQLDVPQPCAAEVGLDSVGALAFLAQTPADNASCYSYAQGGSQVTLPYGPSNAFYFTQLGQSSGQLGQITKPVVSQIATYLAAHTSFSASQIVTVLAGGNDLFVNLATFQATVGAGGDPTAAATAAVTAMATAGAQLSGLVQSQILANGATHVVVVNLPDVSLTPLGLGAGASGQALIKQMTQAFNAALTTGTTGLPASDSLLVVDAFGASEDQSARPAQYGLTNVTTPACNLPPATATPLPSSPGQTGLTIPGVGWIPLASSLFCTQATLITDSANVTPTDPNGVLHYEYADTVHPTPYGYRLLAELVGEQMAIKGWL